MWNDALVDYKMKVVYVNENKSSLETIKNSIIQGLIFRIQTSKIVISVRNDECMKVQNNLKFFFLGRVINVKIIFSNKKCKILCICYSNKRINLSLDQ